MSVVGSVLVISTLGNYIEAQEEAIPDWIKGVAGLWAEDEITDLEFIDALEFLINQSIIQIDDSKQVQELKNEIKRLESKIASQEQDNAYSTVPSASDFEAKLNQLMYHPEYIKGLIDVMEVDGKVNQVLWKACESVGYDDYESFQLFTTIVAEAALLLEAENSLKDQHYVIYAINDYYETNGFPDNPPNFKERWNDFILTKALMGLCFEDLESEFGRFYGMQWGGVGLKDRHHLDVMRDVFKDYLT